MKNKLLLLVPAFLFFLFTNIFAQVPPPGSAGNFAVFTSAGAFNNLGASVITGDVGTGAGLFTGFPPGTYSGQSHVADAAAVQAATDVNNAYAFLAALSCPNALAVGLGNGQVIVPGTYCIGAAATLNGDLILDAQGTGSALFIIKINGALATGLSSRVQLTNGALAANVYWQVNGQFDLGDNSAFTGTLIAAGAINLLEGSSVNGRTWSTGGAISLHNNAVALPFTLLALNERSFSAGKQGSTAVLRWSATPQETTAVFTAERSGSGTAGTWQAIGNISAAANNNSERNYMLTDNAPNKGANYYRIQTTGSNGVLSYSNIAVLSFDLKEKIQATAFPNPVKDDLTIAGAPAGSMIILTDISGRLLEQQKTGSISNNRMHTNNLVAGVYLVKIISANGEAAGLMVTKQ